MAEAIVTLLLDRFDEVMAEQAKNGMDLVKGAHSQIDNIKDQLKRISLDLNDAEDRSQNNEEKVKEWLGEVEDTLYVMEDIVDYWNNIILRKRIKEDSYSGNQSVLIRAPSSFGRSIVLRWKRFSVESKIKNMNKRLDSVAKKKDQFYFVSTTESSPLQIREAGYVAQSLSSNQTYVGQDESKQRLLHLLLQKEESMKVISLVGMGGVGKTTLAQRLYNDSRVVNHFDARAWIRVGQRFSEERILRTILKSMNRYSSSSYKNVSLDSLRRLFRSSVSQKRFLLVLDDLWDSDVWHKLMHDDLLHASEFAEFAVLLTTRSESVASHIDRKYIHFVPLLTDEGSWALFQSVTPYHRGDRMFENIGKRIVRIGRGLPLSIKCIGGMLRSKQLVEEWKSVRKELKNVNHETLDGFFSICYQDLPTALKRCFCYCLIYPDDVEEIDADKLVRMWLAHGYLGSTGNSDRPEKRGHTYIEELVNRSFFQILDKDEDGKIKSFSIHDLIRDLAAHYYHLQFRTEMLDNRMNIRHFISQMTYRHLTILSSTEAPSTSPRSSPNACKARLRTLFAPEIDQKALQPDLFSQLSYIRVLSFCDGNLSLLPKEIGKLIYLRYLDLSGNPLEELPEFICRLCNLETLDLDDCVLFKKLPSGIGKLIMLRHLLTRNTPRLQCFPEGLEKLTTLRTLGKFMVGKELNKLKYLKNLNNLEGTLELDFYELNDEDAVSDAEDGDVEDVVSDAEDCNLKDKIYLQELKLTFNVEVSSSKVFEALEAPPNLHRLHIYGLRAKNWSSWISAKGNHLKELKINFCTQCLTFPPLWELPLLEILDLDAMMAMRSVSLPDFLGIRSPIDRGTIEHIESGPEVSPSGETDSIQVARSDTEEGPSSTNRSTELAHSDKEESKDVEHSGTTSVPSGTEVVSSSPSLRMVAFPKLLKLRFNFCIEWDTWEDITVENNVSILPSLLELEVSRCEMLTSLPHELLRRISTLRSLKIGYCSRLSDLYRDNEGRARLPMNITTIVPTLVPAEQDLELVA